MSSVQNATLQAVQYNNYQIIDTMVFNGTQDRQTFISSYSAAKSAFLQANPSIQQNPQNFTCQTCGTSEADWTNYFFTNFPSINASRYNPPAQENISGYLVPTCGSYGNQVKTMACAAMVGASSAGIGLVVGGWGCWCTFCSKNSWLASKICAN